MFNLNFTTEIIAITLIVSVIFFLFRWLRVHVVFMFGDDGIVIQLK